MSSTFPDFLDTLQNKVFMLPLGRALSLKNSDIK